jgi:tetratricopeptide (TPR) repeat protein
MATRRTGNFNEASVNSKDVNALIATAKTASETGDYPTAIKSFEELLKIDPKNADIMSNLGVLYFNFGSKQRAADMFAGAFDLTPKHPQTAKLEALQKNYLTALCSAAAEQFGAQKYQQAIDSMRKALSLDPEHPGVRVDLANMLEMTNQPAVLSDFIPEATLADLGRHLLIACMPKSGSTFLKETLCTLTGWPDTFLSYAYLQNEQELYLPYLLRVAALDTVTQQHCRATGPNTQIMQAFGIRPVVLVRRLEDVVLSMSDFYDSGAIINTFFGDIWPTLGQSEKYDLVIDHVMPWYVEFYASWERAHRLGRLDCLFITYEEMVADKPAAIIGVSEFLGLDKSAEECRTAAEAVDGDAQKTRFNKGVAGRGTETLRDEQKDRLRALASAYKEIDLKRIGLAE